MLFNQRVYLHCALNQVLSWLGLIKCCSIGELWFLKTCQVSDTYTLIKGQLHEEETTQEPGECRILPIKTFISNIMLKHFYVTYNYVCVKNSNRKYEGT